MGIEAIGYVLGQQCAPVLAGIKPSNLLIVEKGNLGGLRHVLKGTEIQKYLLYSSEEKDYWFLFERPQLQSLIEQPRNRAFLKTCGYGQIRIESILSILAQRFVRYKSGEGEFPHEMGVLFGYPLNDVLGFIENKGQNFKMSGYWKVYDDVAYADRIFHLYKAVRSRVLELCGQGVGIPDICRVCRTAAATAK